MDYLVLFNVSQSSQLDEHSLVPYSLEQVAVNAKIPYTAIDTGTIVLAKEELGPLLSTFSHYDFYAIDIDSSWQAQDVISHVVTCLEHDWRTGDSVLSKLPASRLIIDSHDDCYLTIQTYSMDLVRQIFTRMVQIYTGTILAEKCKTQPDIPNIPNQLLLSFWNDNFGLTILRETTEIIPSGLKIGVTKKPFNFQAEAEYIPEFWIKYDLQNKHWDIEK